MPGLIQEVLQDTVYPLTVANNFFSFFAHSFQVTMHLELREGGRG